MNTPDHLFARLTGEIEDLHALAIEGQSSDLPSDASRMLAGQICNGLHRCALILSQIDELLALDT